VKAYKALHLFPSLFVVRSCVFETPVGEEPHTY